MRYLFRVDSATAIGLGHLTRSLALANKLKELGAECFFVCKCLPGCRLELIERQGHTLLILPEPCRGETPDAWFSNQDSDAQQTIDIIVSSKLQPVDWLVVDHYWLNKQWHQQLRPYANKVLVIDDLANRYHDCDVLLDQTPGRQPKCYANLVPKHCKRLCGSQFALLRDEFSVARQTLQARSFKAPLTLAISLGGTDPDNVSLAILQALAKLPKSWIKKVTLIITRPPDDMLAATIAQSPHHIICTVNCEDIATLYASADLVIGASGVSAIERCAVGTPSLLYLYADNQREIAGYLEKNDTAIIFADHFDRSLNRLGPILGQLVTSPMALSAMAHEAQNVCDAMGATRVANWLNQKQFPIGIVPATNGHCMLTYSWQQQPSQRRYFRNSEVPTEEEHKQWYLKTLTSQHKKLFIIQQLGQPCGYIRFDNIAEQGWEVSILLSKSWQGLGLAGQALAWALQQSEFFPLVAEVHIANRASQTLFEQAGFTRTDATHFRFDPLTTKDRPKESPCA